MNPNPTIAGSADTRVSPSRRARESRGTTDRREIAHLYLKKTLRGARRVLRGQSVTLARQEVWAFLLVHNMIAALAARAGALVGIDPDEISFTAVLGLVRAHLQADTCCPHCGRRPGDPRARPARRRHRLPQEPRRP